ncbi:hypothetical protein WA026_002781, partial [Henosepilachna vigintioctopunctata]
KIIYTLPPNTQELCEVVNSYGLKHTIHVPTRNSHISKSCIDNIITNGNYCFADIIATDFSDHDMVQVITFNLQEFNTKTTITRMLSDERILDLVEQLEHVNWNTIKKLKPSDENGQWNIFMNLILIAFNYSCPLKRINIKHFCKQKQILRNEKSINCKKRLRHFTNVQNEQWYPK